jgi:hypothetical protein
MKNTLLILLLAIVFSSNAQYVETETPHVYVQRDTVTNICQARFYYRGKHTINVIFRLNKQFDNDVRVYYNTPITFNWVQGCYIEVYSKNCQTIKIEVK